MFFLINDWRQRVQAAQSCVFPEQYTKANWAGHGDQASRQLSILVSNSIPASKFVPWVPALTYFNNWAPRLDGHSEHNSYWVMYTMWMRACLPSFLRSPELRGKTKRCEDREHVSPCGYHWFLRPLPLNIQAPDQHLSGSTTLIFKFLSSYLLPCFLSRVSHSGRHFSSSSSPNLRHFLTPAPARALFSE